MAPYTMTLGGTATSSDISLGGLGAGYFATVNFSASPTVRMLNVTAPGTTVSSVGLTTATFAASVASNGAVYLITSPGGTTRTVRSLTRTGSTLSVSTVGSFTLPTSATGLLSSQADYGATSAATGFLSVNTVGLINLSTGALSWTFDPTASGHSTFDVRGCLSSTRIILKCDTHSAWELFNSSGTLLSSLSYAGTGTLPRIRPLPGGRFFMSDQVDGTDPNQFKIAVMSTTSDTLAWEWGPNTLTSNYTASNHREQIATWGDVAILGPFTQVGAPAPYDAVSLYAINCLTGEVTASATTALMGEGLSDDEQWWADATNVILTTQDNTFVAWQIVAPSTAHTYLRRWQSPAMAPSRVRPVDLRRRQTPRIT